MPVKGYILAIDEGTTGSTALLIDREGQVTGRAYRELHQIFPQPGWVEHDPGEILRNCIAIMHEVVQKACISFTDIKGIGITNQRETTVVWERATGKPVYNAIVWQCRRTAPLCEYLKKKVLGPIVRQKTGLPIDAYCSATKIRWLLDNIPDGQHRAENGDLLFGTIDTWLVWNLSNGHAHVTDYSNASRTMLFNINTLMWDKELLGHLNIPEIMMPKVLPSSYIYGQTSEILLKKSSIPIAGIAGDQQASLFGQVCFEKGLVKNTYGTGSFLMMNIGDKPVFSNSGLITTIAWGLGNTITYALEGSIFVTGAAVQWLRDELGLIKNSSEIANLAATVPNNGGVYFVPAFAGLGAPYWDMYARGTIVGLTRGSNKGHIARAVEESIAYQARDVIEAMKTDIYNPIPMLRVDGGGSADKYLLQFQSDILGIPIQRAYIAETTALGAAYLAGLAVGVWQNVEKIGKQWRSAVTFEPKMSVDERESLYHRWKQAVSRAQGWEEK
ncbi:MAG: glycerol kinase GlpK [Dehalococcoidales bacterium]|nr:glycerol kinase GlpK [Dehalococcoidales bacterium]